MAEVVGQEMSTALDDRGSAQDPANGWLPEGSDDISRNPSKRWLKAGRRASHSVETARHFAAQVNIALAESALNNAEAPLEHMHDTLDEPTWIRQASKDTGIEEKQSGGTVDCTDSVRENYAEVSEPIWLKRASKDSRSLISSAHYNEAFEHDKNLNSWLIGPQCVNRASKSQSRGDECKCM